MAVVGPADATPGGNSQGNGQSQGAAQGQAKSQGKAPAKSQEKAPAKSQGQSHSQGQGNAPAGTGQGHGHAYGHDNAAAGSQGSPGDQGGQGQANGNGAGQAGGGTQGQASGRGGHGDPPGNNGTVKIETSGDADGTPNNVPHVGCEFQIEWYGFDEGDDIVSTVTFAAHAPTGDVAIGGTAPAQVFVGGDPASGAGTDGGLDGVQRYHLTFDGEPHPKQGYHVKLTIHTPGSIGADTKHKVFWVQPCEETPPGGEEETPPPGGEEETPPSDTEVEGKQDRDRDRDVEVQGKQATRPQASAPGVVAQVPTAVNAGISAGLGLVTSPVPLLVTLLGLMLAAAGWVVRRRGA